MPKTTPLYLILIGLLFGLLTAFGCRGNAPKSSDRLLTADVPLHLEDHIDAARIEGSEIPKDIPPVFEWRFDQDQPAWKIAVPFRRQTKPPHVARVDDALRITLTKENRNRWGTRHGAVYVDLPDWNRDDWGFVIVRARTKDEISGIGLEFNLRDKPGDTILSQRRFLFSGDYVTVIPDGEVHSYLLRTANVFPDEWKGPWTQLGIDIFSGEREKDDSRKGPTMFDILSVSVVPKELNYAKSKAGMSGEAWGTATRRALYSHIPGKLEYLVKVPEKARLDFGFGMLKNDVPVKYKVSIRDKKAGTRTLLEKTCSGDGPWPQHSVDLSGRAGKAVTLILETEAERAGNVAFWGAPTLSGRRATEKPNVIFYVIDGAGADFMSVYGYNRRTTPNLERLAAEGAVFENAYSNSSWTKVSVPSFMTSLHCTVLGGNKTESDPLPGQAVTMAERMHRAGYMTEVLTSNPYCGRASSLDRGVDSVMDSYFEEKTIWSSDFHGEFWSFREAYPGEPYWVHFQPTDVHWPWKPVAPFAGLFASAEDRQAFTEMRDKIMEIPGESFAERIEKLGIDRIRYSQNNRKLYDEAMAYQDYTIGKLVGRIKDRGEWENTLFIVAADHAYESAGLPLLDPEPLKWDHPILAAQVSRIPMIFVWAGKIAAGQRFSQPVSMIDMLPTILELAGLPAPEIAQGQSLAPLLLGKPGWKPRPVIFDEFNIENEYFVGSIEVLDGRWGASLRIDPRPDEKKDERQRLRPAPLLVFDVWEDPYALKSLHEERPDLVEKYAKMLDRIYKEHQALAKKFTRAGEVPMTQDQIETLRSLGYLR